MSRRMGKTISWTVVLGAVVLFVVFDLATTDKSKWNTNPVTPAATDAEMSSRSMVAIATSEDEGLPDPAPIDAPEVTYDQVKAVVYRALDLDTSEHNIRKVIEKDDWVAIKVNMVTAPIESGRRKRTGFWRDSIEHWGDVTDLRVVKAVISYLIEKVGPKQITIVEGPAEWSRKGTSYGNAYDTDGWELQWRAFGNLSYLGMVQEFNAMQSTTVVDTCDLNDCAYRFEPVPGGPLQRVGPQWRDSGRFGWGVPVPFTGTPRKGYYMPTAVLDPDKMLSIAVMKTNYGGATLAMKNYVGTLASRPFGDGTSKTQMDSNGYERGFVDLFSYNPAVYAVIEGFWANEGSWPGTRWNLHRNMVIVSGDPVAADAVALRTMEINPRDVEHVYLGAYKGFGTLDLDQIEVVGRPVEEVQYPFKRHKSFMGIGFQRWLVNGPHEGADLEEDLLGGEATYVPLRGQMVGDWPWEVWEHPPSYPEAYVDLTYRPATATVSKATAEEPGLPTFPDLANTTTYAFTLIESEKEQGGYLWFGADDGARVWLNGELVLDRPGPMAMNLGEFRVPVMLKKGINTLMVKVINRYGGSGFAASIVDVGNNKSGTMLFDIRPMLPGEQPTAVKEQVVVQVPSQYALEDNFPNPFNTSTLIRFSLPRASNTRLTVYDLLGREVRTLGHGVLSAGYHQMTWDGLDQHGQPVASGVYVYRLEADGFSEAKRMTLLR